MICWIYDIIKEIKNAIDRWKIKWYIKNGISLFEVSKNTESKNPKVIRTKNGKTMLLSKCTVYDSK